MSVVVTKFILPEVEKSNTMEYSTNDEGDFLVRVEYSDDCSVNLRVKSKLTGREYAKFRVNERFYDFLEGAFLGDKDKRIDRFEFYGMEREMLDIEISEPYGNNQTKRIVFDLEFLEEINNTEWEGWDEEAFQKIMAEKEEVERKEKEEKTKHLKRFGPGAEEKNKKIQESIEEEKKLKVLDEEEEAKKRKERIAERKRKRLERIQKRKAGDGGGGSDSDKKKQIMM